MYTGAIIIEDFYDNPDEIREFALSQEFGVTGNFPGGRTKSFADWDSPKNVIQGYVEGKHGKITKWHTAGGFNAAFQYTTSRNRSWIHADQTTSWAAVCYLTPDAPITAGTGLFRHKETGLEWFPEGNTDLINLLNSHSQDMTKWDMTTMIGNKYNRLIMYRGNMYHSSLDYFGTDKYNGRLFQTFFFDTER